MANHYGSIGVHHCAEIAEQNDWLFRSQPENDIGIDAHMEFIDPTGKAKQLLAVQIKAGKSWFAEKNREYVIFRHMNERQYNYWTTNSLPCILVLYNPEEKMCIWQKLTTETIERKKIISKNGNEKVVFKVKVPYNQVFLDRESNEILRSYINLPEHVLNYNFLLSQKTFMQIIQNGGSVKLHSEEWVNKCSGQGDTELIVDDGKKVTKYKYPYWFPFTSYIEVFPKLFPWAEFAIDEDYYEEYDKAHWQDLCCYYEEEEEEWICIDDSFEEFRRKLAPIRSIDHCGEVAEYMLVLSINELGKSFLNVDEYVSNSQPYSAARPKAEKECEE